MVFEVRYEERNLVTCVTVTDRYTRNRKNTAELNSAAQSPQAPENDHVLDFCVSMKISSVLFCCAKHFASSGNHVVFRI